MISISYLIGGIKLIQQDKQNIAEVDIFDDLIFAKDLDNGMREKVLNYLNENDIKYNLLS